MGVAKFDGTDSSLNRVKGVIGLDGTVDISVDVTDKQRKIYFVMPLN